MAFCANEGLTIHPTKSKLLCISTPAQPPVSLAGQAIPVVSAVTYLGVTVEGTCHMLDHQVATRLQRAEAAFTAVRRVAQHLHVSTPGLRLQLLDALVMSRLLFAAVTWSPVAPAGPVIVPTQCPSLYGAHAVWPSVEVAHRKWLRWAL